MFLTWIRAFWALSVLVVLCGTAKVAAAQEADGKPELIPYADASFGFELEVPAGWSYERSRFQRFKDSIGLLRGKSPGGRRALQILIFRSFDMKPFEDWVVDFGKALAELTQSERVDWETVQIPPRAGAVLSYMTKVGADRTQSHCLCVPFDPHTVWVLIYTGAALSEDEARQVRASFDAIVETLKVMYDPQRVEQLGPALDRGKALCDRLHRDAERVRIDDTEHAYEMVIGGKPVGYLVRRVWRDEYVFSRPGARRPFTKRGLRVHEYSWRFAEDGTVRFTRLDLFSSFDLRSELIENFQVQFPAADVQPQEPLIKTDQVVREDDVLFSSFKTSLSGGLPDPGKPISVGPVYLDLAWVRLLPGLLLGGAEDTHAFAIYNTQTRALISHRITPQGKHEISGWLEPAYRFESQTGFIEDPTLLYTDPRGFLVRLEAGDVVLKRAERANLEERYGPRRKAVHERFDIPLPEEGRG